MTTSRLRAYNGPNYRPIQSVLRHYSAWGYTMARGPGKTQRLYRVEDVAPILAVERIRTIASVRKWVQSILVGAWARRRWPARVRRPIKITLDNSKGYSYGDSECIELVSCHRDRKAVVLHELAHVVTSRLGDRYAAHGTRWLKEYKALLRRFVGLKALKALNSGLGGCQPKKI